jgi:hypothetical protein
LLVDKKLIVGIENDIL